MKKLIALAALIPAPALAHRVHAPVPVDDVAAHAGAHLAPAVVIIVLAAAVALYRRTRG